MYAVTAFTSGFVIMVLELVASRILGPFLGTSLPVWTSIIGIILAALSIGYWAGGKFADKNPSVKPLILILLLAASSIGIIPLFQETVLMLLVALLSDVRINAIFAALLLFTIPSTLLGMVSPYAMRLSLHKITATGRTAGNLSAIATIGSIVGTFVGGFVLIGSLPSSHILFLLCFILFLLATTLMIQGRYIRKNVHLLLIVATLLTIAFLAELQEKSNTITIDTPYNRVLIYDRKDESSNEMIRYLQMNTEIHSAIFLNSQELVFLYTRYYRLIKHFKPDVKHALMIGGGAYSYPKDYLHTFPDSTMDVVEIDPKITEIAKKYFGLQDSPRLSIFHEDGRTYLNRTTKKYDAIFNDAFSSYYSIPFQLTTKEAVGKMYESLGSDGVVISNIISSLSGPKSLFLHAEVATYTSIFPHVSIFPVQGTIDSQNPQNIILVALKKEPKNVDSEDPELSLYLNNQISGDGLEDGQILTDNFAPVDQYIMKFL